MVARAIVSPKDGHIPIRLLNMDCQPVTIYKGTKIACAEPEAIDNIREISAVGGTKNPICTEQEQEEVLNNILSTMPETLKVTGYCTINNFS